MKGHDAVLTARVDDPEAGLAVEPERAVIAVDDG
jgi:hypothetical protein